MTGASAVTMLIRFVALVNKSVGAGPIVRLRTGGLNLASSSSLYVTAKAGSNPSGFVSGTSFKPIAAATSVIISVTERMGVGGCDL